MDTEQPERLMRVLATSPSRRQALGGVVGAVFEAKLAHDSLLVSARGGKGKGKAKGQGKNKRAPAIPPPPPPAHMWDRHEGL
jgi:hypothetical protein